MANYSFLDVQGAISGPNGSFQIAGSGAANSEEGVDINMKEEKNTQTVGGGGEVMNSLHAGNAGRVTIRLLKTSPANSLLSAMYGADRQSSLVWGQNTILIRDIARGDVYNCTECAFAKFPNNKYSKDGNMLEWEFDAGVVDPSLASGIPGISS